MTYRNPPRYLAGLALGVIALLCSLPALALAPVRVQGAVPDEATRTKILSRMRELYPDRQLVDELVVRGDLRALPQWSEQVLQLLRPELSQVSAGELRMRGSDIELRGRVAKQAQLDELPQLLRGKLLTPAYRFTAALTSAGTADQAQLDELLARRSVEFELGKDLLTDQGRAVLLDLVALLKQFGQQRRFEIVGHTDAGGSAEANLLLSQARAESVRRFLIEAGIDAALLKASGVGASQPVASNASPQGRARNRRIELRVLAGS